MIPEAILQEQCADWLRIQVCLGNVLKFHHSPNETSAPVQWRVKRGKLGTSNGFPDLLIYLPNGKILHAELKSKTGRLSDEQAAWRDALKAMGLPWALIRSPEALEAFVNRERL